MAAASANEQKIQNEEAKTGDMKGLKMKLRLTETE